MKKVFVAGFTLISLVTPLQTNAAWYWLLNPANPEQGDFVQMSALDYAETEISKNLLVYIEDDFKNLLEESENYDQCEDTYDHFMDSLQRSSTTTLITKFEEKDFNDCIRVGQIQEALDECDLEYFDEEFSGGQKVTYHRQISVCKEEMQKDVEVIKVVAPAQIQTSPVVPQQVIPAVAKAPVTLKTTPVSDLAVEDATEENEQIKEPNDEESNVEITEKKVSVESEQQATSATPSNFFQKIINFFSNLFSW